MMSRMSFTLQRSSEWETCISLTKAKAILSKLKAEIDANKRAAKFCRKEGVNNLTRAIGGKQTKSLAWVIRDKDIADGGKKGQVASNPRDADAIVKRTWKAVYDGMDG